MSRGRARFALAAGTRLGLAAGTRLGRAVRMSSTAAAIGLLGFVGAPVATADPATSADSAWSALPSERGVELSDPNERRGRAVFDQRCAACHGDVPDEVFGPPFLPPMPGTQALAARYQGALPAALEERTDLTAEFIEGVVRGGLGAMPFFRPTELSDEDLQALAAYLTRDNDAAED